MAMCVMAVVGDAPCQCFSAGEIQTTSIDADKSSYYHQSRNEIAGDKPCSQQLSRRELTATPQNILDTEDNSGLVTILGESDNPAVLEAAQV